jgi:hypothetical protein
MVASFDANARVVDIIVGSSGVYYQLIGADGQLHIRDYSTWIHRVTRSVPSEPDS